MSGAENPFLAVVLLGLAFVAGLGLSGRRPKRL
jgi:hypothetical protein